MPSWETARSMGNAKLARVRQAERRGLKVDAIDLFYQHRVVAGAVKDLIREGKVAGFIICASNIT